MIREQFAVSSSQLRPEAQLILCCARARMDAAIADRILTILQDAIDWDYLLRLALHHRVVSLVYRNLEMVAPARMPETVRATIKQQLQVDLQGSLFLTKELLHLLALFDQHGIPVAPYKGPVLAASVYQDLVLRPFTDLDILVQERDIAQAMDLLSTCGYEIIRPLRVAHTSKGLQTRTVKHLVLKSPWAYQLVLWHPERQVVVELHWRVTPRYIFPRTPEQVWQGLQPVTVAGVSVLSLAPETLLWFLCVHGAKHQWGRLNWICDIAELIRTYPDLNWDGLVAQVKTIGIERRLYLGLVLAKRLLQTPLPKVIESNIRITPHVQKLSQQVTERIFDQTEQPVASSYLERFAFQLRAMDRWADRGRYLLRFANGADSAPPAAQAMLQSSAFLGLFSLLPGRLQSAQTYTLSPLGRMFKNLSER